MLLSTLLLFVSPKLISLNIGLYTIDDVSLKVLENMFSSIAEYSLKFAQPVKLFFAPNTPYIMISPDFKPFTLVKICDIFTKLNRQALLKMMWFNGEYKDNWYISYRLYNQNRSSV